MKAGVCQWVFNRMLVDGEMNMMDCVEFVGKQTDAECFEPLSRYWDPERDVNEQAEQVRDLCDDLALEVYCYTLDSDFAVYDRDVHEETVADCILALDTALILDAQAIRVDPRTSLPPEHADSPDLDYIVERMAEGMQQIADEAADAGLLVGVENHGRLVGSMHSVRRLIDLVDRPNFGANIDFTNFKNVFGEDHVEATRLLAPDVVHAHAKDCYYRAKREDDTWHETPDGVFYKAAIGGQGDAQWPLLFSIIYEAGYDGAVSLEVSLPEDTFGSVIKGVDTLLRILAEVEES